MNNEIKEITSLLELEYAYKKGYRFFAIEKDRALMKYLLRIDIGGPRFRKILNQLECLEQNYDGTSGVFHIIENPLSHSV